ncbi:MAG: hypothetical protein AAB152_05550 [Candidatus Coatesbacteria bacterium]
MGVAIMLNNLFHDFAVALLAASLLAVWIAGRPSSRVPPKPLRALERVFARVMAGCWAVILLGGAVRTWAYREYEWAPAAGRGQVVALVVKHVVLVAVVVAGARNWWRLRRRLRS